MKQEPQNVDAALSHVIKVEVFEQLPTCQGMMVDEENGHAKCQLRTVCAVAESSDTSKTTALHKRMDELQEALEQAMKGISALATWIGVVELLRWTLLPLLALPRVLVRRHQLLRVQPKLEEPVIRRLDAGVATSDIPLRRIHARSASSWDTGLASVTKAINQPLTALRSRVFCVCSSLPLVST